MIKSRLLYTLLLYALLPQALLHLLWRSLRQRAYLEHIPERFGLYNISADITARQPLIWVHAVSVGETRAAEPLIDALQRKYPQHRILLTHMTPTGRETGEIFQDVVYRNAGALDARLAAANGRVNNDAFSIAHNYSYYRWHAANSRWRADCQPGNGKWGIGNLPVPEQRHPIALECPIG